MTTGGLMIIDDVEASLATMTPLGRNVVGQAAKTVRQAVVAHANRRGWPVVGYESYVAWACIAMRPEDRTWLVLDPLFPVQDLGIRARRLRLTRQFDSSDTIVVRKYAPHTVSIDVSGLSAEIGLMDDAAASGTTLIHVARMAGDSGSVVAQVLLCAGSREAQDRFRKENRSASWSQFVGGDWQVIHLRDGCANLAYSARPIDHKPIVGVDGVAVELRVASYGVFGNHWQVLYMDRGVREAVTAGRLEVVRALSAALGRQACVRDLSLLGQFVPALVSPGERVTGDVALERMLEA